MLTLGVPPSVAQRGGFSAADALFDGCEWLGCSGMHGSCLRGCAKAVHAAVHVCMPGALLDQLQKGSNDQLQRCSRSPPPASPAPMPRRRSRRWADVAQGQAHAAEAPGQAGGGAAAGAARVRKWSPQPVPRHAMQQHHFSACTRTMPSALPLSILQTAPLLLHCITTSACNISTISFRTLTHFHSHEKTKAAASQLLLPRLPTHPRAADPAPASAAAHRKPQQRGCCHSQQHRRQAPGTVPHLPLGRGPLAATWCTSTLQLKVLAPARLRRRQHPLQAVRAAGHTNCHVAAGAGLQAGPQRLCALLRQPSCHLQLAGSCCFGAAGGDVGAGNDGVLLAVAEREGGGASQAGAVVHLGRVGSGGAQDGCLLRGREELQQNSQLCLQPSPTHQQREAAADGGM